MTGVTADSATVKSHGTVILSFRSSFFTPPPTPVPNLTDRLRGRFSGRKHLPKKRKKNPALICICVGKEEFVCVCVCVCVCETSFFLSHLVTSHSYSGVYKRTTPIFSMTKGAICCTRCSHLSAESFTHQYMLYTHYTMAALCCTIDRPCCTID